MKSTSMRILPFIDFEMSNKCLGSPAKLIKISAKRIIGETVEKMAKKFQESCYHILVFARNHSFASPLFSFHHFSHWF